MNRHQGRADLRTRRDVLALGGAVLAATGLCGRLFAAPAAGPRLLVAFLRGGYDCANLLVPYSSSFYYESRPTIAIAAPDATSTTGALALDADWALHPAVRDSVGGLYLQRQAAFIPFAGTDDLSRSHFETQDSIEMGQPKNAAHDYRSGFLGRLSTVLQGAAVDAAPIAFTEALPLSFAGATTVPNLSLKRAGKAPFDDRQVQLLSDLYAGQHLQSEVASGLELRQVVAQEVAQEMQEASRAAITTKGFELEAERMGRLMRDRYRIGFIDVGGWDTHVGEGGSQGALATNLASLGKGLQAFAQSLDAEWRNTVVVVVSEFGRTFRENGNRGTDHGHGSVYWILGGGINGGRIVGQQQRVSRATLFQDRDFPVLNDYRAVFGGLFRSMWGLSAKQSGQIFPQVEPAGLGLI
jgi:uncharacterized protein (DUF1501 family)